jgi:hypothetical protein
MNGTTNTERPPLVKIVGTVADIILASAPNKPGKIELESGKMLHAFPDKLQMVRKGEAYDFGCEPTEFRGVLNHTVRAVRAASGSNPLGSTPSTFVTTEEVLPQRRPARAEGQSFTEPHRNGATLTTAAAQKPQAQQQNGYYRPTAPKDSERMWTCAILGHYVDRGDVPLDKETVKAAINLLREAYQETYGQDDHA